MAPCRPVGPWLAGCDRLGEACIRLSMHRARAACVRLNMRQAQHLSGSACIEPVQHTSSSACVRLSMRQAQDASGLRPVQYASGHFSVFDIAHATASYVRDLRHVLDLNVSFQFIPPLWWYLLYCNVPCWGHQL